MRPGVESRRWSLRSLGLILLLEARGPRPPIMARRWTGRRDRMVLMNCVWAWIMSRLDQGAVIEPLDEHAVGLGLRDRLGASNCYCKKCEELRERYWWPVSSPIRASSPAARRPV